MKVLGSLEILKISNKKAGLAVQPEKVGIKLVSYFSETEFDSVVQTFLTELFP